MLNVGIIGFGGIARTVIGVLADEGRDRIRLTGVLVRHGGSSSAGSGDSPHVGIFTDLGALLEQRPDLIVECAGHDAVREHAERILAVGIDLIVISIGALADEALYERVRAAARQGGSSLILPAGAVGGIDALSALRLAGLTSVCYRSRKPPRAWAGTPAEKNANLDALEQATCVYRGNAREAALLFPKNSNVAATVALAGIGFEKTQVELIADPTLTDNRHEIEAHGPAGSFHIRLTGQPLASSPRTSALAAYSVARSILVRDSAIVI